MISEAVGACLPVVAVSPETGTHETREIEFRRLLADRGWYRSLSLAHLSPESFLTALEAITPRDTNASDELAAAIADRLPELFARD